MVSQTLIISMIIAVCISVLAIAVPFIIIYLISRKRETGMFASFGLGLLAYFWSQYLLPIPILWALTLSKGFMSLYNSEEYSVWYILITAFILSILAGLGRLWSVWLMNKRTPSLYRATCSALGFATFKAMSVVTTYLTYIRYARTYNAGGREGLLAALSDGDKKPDGNALDAMIKSLMEGKPFDVVMEGINVIMFLLVEIALIVIIYKGITIKKMWIATAISTGIGFAYTFATMILGKYIETGAIKWINHGFLFACGIVSLWFALRELKIYRRRISYGGIPNEVI